MNSRQTELLIRARMALLRVVDHVETTSPQIDLADERYLLEVIDRHLVGSASMDLVGAFARAAGDNWQKRKAWSFVAARILGRHADELATENAIEADEQIARRALEESEVEP